MQVSAADRTSVKEAVSMMMVLPGLMGAAIGGLVGYGVAKLKGQAKAKGASQAMQ